MTKYNINDVLAKLRGKGIDMSLAQQLQLAMVLGAGDAGITEIDLDAGVTRKVKIDQEKLEEFMEGVKE